MRFQFFVLPSLEIYLRKIGKQVFEVADNGHE